MTQDESIAPPTPGPANQPVTCGPRRIPLPLSSGVSILPGTSALITARSQLHAFCPERIVIKDARHWRVNEIRIGERKIQRPYRGDGVAAGILPPLAPVPPGGEVAIEVVYDGPRLEGAPFECCVIGTEGMIPRSPPTRPVAPSRRVADSSGVAVLPNASIRMAIDPRDFEFWPERLAIKDARDWVVNDILIRGRSLCLRPGDLPGAMFAEDGNPCLFRMGALAPNDEFAIVATYLGDRDHGAQLEYELLGHDRPSGLSASSSRFLPMSSGVNILPRTSAQITSRPQWTDGLLPGQAFLIERIVVADADDWVIDDVKIGNLSQFAQSGDIPAAAFAADVPDGLLCLDPARLEIDVTMIVTHVGSSASGATFVCGMLGRVVDVGSSWPLRHGDLGSLDGLGDPGSVTPA